MVKVPQHNTWGYRKINAEVVLGGVREVEEEDLVHEVEGGHVRGADVGPLLIVVRLIERPEGPDLAPGIEVAGVEVGGDPEVEEDVTIAVAQGIRNHDQEKRMKKRSPERTKTKRGTRTERGTRTK